MEITIFHDKKGRPEGAAFSFMEKGRRYRSLLFYFSRPFDFSKSSMKWSEIS